MSRGHPSLQGQPVFPSRIICGVPDLINCGLHVPGVCRGHGLQGNWVLTSYFHVANLQQAARMLLEKLGDAYFSTWEHVVKAMPHGNSDRSIAVQV